MFAQSGTHIPVLLEPTTSLISRTLQDLSTSVSKTVYCVDATFGQGGHSNAILENAPSNTELIAIDRDALMFQKEQARAVQQKWGAKLRTVVGAFGDLFSIVKQCIGETKAAAIFFDLGMNSLQLEDKERGFSFYQDGPLDMRFERNDLLSQVSSGTLSAYDIVNDFSEPLIADILYQNSNEHRSRRIARAIVHSRSKAPIKTTTQLADIIKRAVGKAKGNEGSHPATKSFQALRIYVNNELEQLRHALEDSEKLLMPGGCLAVITFHSLEDTIVKKFFKDRADARGTEIPPLDQ